MPRLSLALLALLSALLAGCATPEKPGGASEAPLSFAGNGPATGDTDANEEDALFFEMDSGPATTAVADPLEGFNRTMFQFNDILSYFILIPLSKGYDAIMPDLAQTGISNFFRNLGMPLRGISALLQGKPDVTGKELAGFVVNSTIGVGGLFNPAEGMVYEQAPPAEDLGQTLGTWGLAPGPYLVLPLFGPSNLRDGIGFFGGRYLDPVYYANEWEVQLGLNILDTTNALPGLIERQKRIREAAVDPYAAVRDAYMKIREAAVKE